MTGPAGSAAVVPGLVSVILVNYKGADDTITCLRSLEALHWPAGRLEVVCVDNGSADGSLERIAAAAPSARLVDAGANLGFAGGCNAGVAAARGEYVALLNNDARPHPDWVAEAVGVFEADRAVVSVASKVLDWEGQRIDFVAAALTWYGMGFKPRAEEPDDGADDVARDVLFGTGSAVFFRAEVFRAAGGFDERFFMFFEDVDLGWRLNLLGHRVRYVPTSIAYHKHHATVEKYGRYRESYLLERNALLSMFKNYDDATLARCLAPAMALAVRRSVTATGLDARMLDLQVRPGDDRNPSVSVPKAALAGPLAIDYLVEQLPSLIETRQAIQARRRRSDHQLFRLFGDLMEPLHALPSYVPTYRQVTGALAIAEHFTRGRRIAVVTADTLGPRMAGPAIRAYEIARLLAREHHVTLVTLNSGTVEGDGFDTLAANGKTLRALLDHTDVVVFQGLLLTQYPWVEQTNALLVADIYDPFHLESLEQERCRPLLERGQLFAGAVEALNVQLRRADFLLCASAKQRDFWLGQLAGLGRVNPLTYDEDENLRSLLDVAPFGLPDEPPLQRRSALRGAVPGIGADDKVLLWGGGVYNWFDPLTLLAAVDRVREQVPNVRLVFMGMKHPNPDVPEMEMANRARDLAEMLGLTGRHVFFNESWVPYGERADVLLDADVGVSCHLDHVETEFSFRTRILDYLWAGLPIVCTAGDSMADLVEKEGLGFTVPPGDVDALAVALARVLLDEDAAARARERVRAVARQFTWERSLEPLVRFARNPYRAPDLLERYGAVRPSSAPPPRRPRASLGEDVALARKYLREGGVSEVARRATGRVRRLTTRSRTR